MRTSTKLRLGYVGLAVVDALLSGSRRPSLHQARRLTKPLLMPTLAASLATDERAAGSPLRTTTLLAQAGGWGGDVLLLGHDPRSFALGAGSFGAGHAAYASGFVRHRSSRPLLAGKIARGVLGAWVLNSPLVATGAYRQERMLGPAVAAYSGVLSATVALATNLGPSVSPAGRRFTAAGALMFLASDSILGFSKFVLKSPDPRLEVAVMATYTGAQLLIAEGAARA